MKKGYAIALYETGQKLMSTDAARGAKDCQTAHKELVNFLNVRFENLALSELQISYILADYIRKEESVRIACEKTEEFLSLLQEVAALKGGK